MEKPTIYSLGHSNKSVDEVIELAKQNDITDIVDVRSVPFSKYNPQFNRDDFKRSLERANLKYHWRGKNIGGRDGNVDFEGTLSRLLAVAWERRETHRYAMICSEGNPCDCHRHFTIEPEVNSQGGQVVHLYWKDEHRKQMEKKQGELAQQSLI